MHTKHPYCATIGMHTVLLVICIIIQEMINMTGFCVVNKKQEIGTLCCIQPVTVTMGSLGGHVIPGIIVCFLYSAVTPPLLVIQVVMTTR